MLKDVDISAEASAETVTRATSTFTAPTASELTYKVTDTQTGEVAYNQTGEFTSSWQLANPRKRQSMNMYRIPFLISSYSFQ